MGSKLVRTGLWLRTDQRQRASFLSVFKNDDDSTIGHWHRLRKPDEKSLIDGASSMLLLELAVCEGWLGEGSIPSKIESVSSTSSWAGWLRMKSFGDLGRVLNRALWFVGLVTVLVVLTPITGWWARAYSGPLDRPKGDVLVMLSAAGDDNGGISYSSYWRARYALLAWQTGSFKKIIVSGGGPGISNFLIAEGIPREAIAAEWNSTSTHESGLAMARLLQAYPGKKVLLTSDFHMYRALRVFRKSGVVAVPMPVPDVLQLAQHWDGRFPAFETMLMETTKLLYYAVRGWI